MTRIRWRQRLRKVLSRAIRPTQLWLRRKLLLLVDNGCLLRPAKPDPQHVLLVRVDNIGDFVLWLHAARSLTDFYRRQGRHITLLGSSNWATWAAELGPFDAVISLEQERYKRDLRYRRRMNGTVRALGCGVALHPASTRVRETGDSLIRISGAIERIGFAASGKGSGSDHWYSRLIPPASAVTSELRRNAAFAGAVTGTPCKPRVADLRPSVKRHALSALAAPRPSSPYFVLFPGASHAGRKWPAPNFAELAERLHARTGWAGIVCGGPADISDAASIANGRAAWMRNLAGQTDLAQLTALIADAKLLISNETSAVHIAAALGVPSVCILGGGHFGRFMPYDIEALDGRPLPRVAAEQMPCFGCDWTCKYHPPKEQPMPCIGEVTVHAVWRQAESLLGFESSSLLAVSLLTRGHNPTKGEAEAALVGI